MVRKGYEPYFEYSQGIQGPPYPQDVGPDWLYVSWTGCGISEWAGMNPNPPKGLRMGKEQKKCSLFQCFLAYCGLANRYSAPGYCGHLCL